MAIESVNTSIVIGQDVRVPGPSGGAEIHVQSSPSGNLIFDFDVSSASPSREGTDLIFSTEDGTVVIDGYFEVADESLPTLTLADGVTVDATSFFDGSNLDLTTAAGPAAGSVAGGGTNYDDNAGSLLDGLDKLGMLDGSAGWAQEAYTQEPTDELAGPTGSFSFSVSSDGSGADAGIIAGVYEDGRPNQYINGDSGDQIAAKIDMTFSGVGPGTTIGDITFHDVPSGSFYLGDPAAGGTLVNHSAGSSYLFSEADFLSPGIYFLPDKNSDQDLSFNISVGFVGQNGVVDTITSSVTIIVDAVADRPEDVIGIAVDSGSSEHSVSDKVADHKEFVKGFHEVEHSLSSQDASMKSAIVTVKVSASFSDLDGSESHFLLVEAHDFTNTAYGTYVADDGTIYFKVPVDSAINQALENGSGLYDGVTVTVNSDGSVNVEQEIKLDSPLLSGDKSYDIQTGAMAEENPTDAELNTENNISVVLDPDDKFTVLVDIVNSELLIKAGWASEDGDSSQYLPTGQTHDTDLSAIVDASSSKADGSAPINISISGEDNSGEFISSVSIGAYDASLGTLYFNGVAVNPNSDIIISSNSTSIDLVFKSANDSDADVKIPYKLEVSNAKGAKAEYEGDFTVKVDAVADRAVLESLSADTPTLGNDGMEFKSEGTISHADGFASQSYAGTGKTAQEREVTITLKAEFGDFSDESESHYILMTLPADLEFAPGTSYGTVEVNVDSNGNPVHMDADGSYPSGSTLKTFYKIPVSKDDLDSDGKISLDLPLVCPEGSISGDRNVDFVLVAEETATDDYDYSNNLAFTQGLQTIKVTGFDSNFTIKSGWAYEGNDGTKHGTADHDIESTGSGSGQPGIYGAPIVLDFDSQDTEAVIGVYFEVDPNLGDFILVLGPGKFNILTPDSDGYVRVNASDLKAIATGQSSIYFRPSGLDDSDIDLNYKIYIDDNGEEYTISGTLPLIVDSVADKAVVSSYEVDYAGANTAALSAATVDLEIKGIKLSGDSSEFLYIVVTSDLIASLPDPLPTGFTLISGDALNDFDLATAGTTVNDDAGRFVLQVDLKADPSPIGDDGNLTLERVNLVDSEGKDLSGTVDYQVVVVEGHGSGNDKALWDANSANDAEYDFGNNVAVSNGSSAIKINMVDGKWDIKTTMAYEGDMDKAHEGSSVLAPLSSTGRIMMALDATDPNTSEIVTDFNIDCALGDVSGDVGAIQFAYGSGGSWTSLDLALLAGGKENLIDGKEINTYPDVKINIYDDGTGNLRVSFTFKDYSKANAQVRYESGDYSDKDLDFNWKATVEDTASGHTLADKYSGVGTVVVDAVADKPTEVTDAHGKDGIGASFGTVVEVEVKGKFHDLDGSEKHYLLVTIPVGLTLLNANDLPSYVTMTGQELIDSMGGQYLSYESANGAIDPDATYYKFELEAGDLTNGNASLKLELETPASRDAADAGLPAIDPDTGMSTGDFVYTGDVIAWSQEQAGTGESEKESLGNNDSFTGGGFDVVVTHLGDIKLSTSASVEGLDPNKHGGEVVALPDNAGEITIDYDSDWEKVSSITINFQADDAELGFDLSDHGFFEQWNPEADSGAGAWEVLSPTDPSDPNSFTLDTYDDKHPIRYRPGEYSDRDVKFSWEVEMQDLNTGDTITHKSPVDEGSGNPIFDVIKVDAVADKPEIMNTEAQREGNLLKLNFTAKFHDYKDGSEEHSVDILIPQGYMLSTNSSFYNLLAFDGDGKLIENEHVTFNDDGSFTLHIVVDPASLVSSSGQYSANIELTIPPNGDGKEIKITANADEKNLHEIDPGTDNTDNNHAEDNSSIVVPKFDLASMFKTHNGNSFEDSKPFHNLNPGGEGAEVNDPGTELGAQFLNMADGGLPEGQHVTKVSVEVDLVQIDANGEPILDGSDNPISTGTMAGKLVYFYEDKKSGDITEIFGTVGSDGKGSIEIPSGLEPPFNPKYLSFHPEGHFNGKVIIDSTVTVSEGGVSTDVHVGNSEVSIDAVATLPGEIKSAVDDASGSPCIEINTSFADNDGSEQHYVLLQVPPFGWGVLAGVETEYYDLGNGPVLCYVIKVPNASDVEQVVDNGKGVIVTVSEDGSVKAEISLGGGKGALELSTGALVEEHLTNQSTENMGLDYYKNNISLRPGDSVEWNPDTTPGGKGGPHISVETPEWGFEGDKIFTDPETGLPLPDCSINIGVSNPNDSTVDSIELSLTDKTSGKPVDGYVEYESSSGEAITLRFESDGSVYRVDADGNKLGENLSNNGSVPLDIKGSSILTYHPAGHNDGEINVSVTMQTSKDGETQTSSGGSLIYIDAVADAPILNVDSNPEVSTSGVDGAVVAGGSATLKNFTMTFPDGDGSETHYLLIEAKPGWVFYDDAGAPITDYIIHNGAAYYQVSLAANSGVLNPDGSITYSPNVSVGFKNYTPGEAEISFKYGGMSWEHVKGDSSNFEYTNENNVIVDLGTYHYDKDSIIPEVPGEPGQPGSGGGSSGSWTGGSGGSTSPGHPGGGEGTVTGKVTVNPTYESPNAGEDYAGQPPLDSPGTINFPSGLSGLELSNWGSGSILVGALDGTVSEYFTDGTIIITDSEGVEISTSTGGTGIITLYPPTGLTITYKTDEFSDKDVSNIDYKITGADGSSLEGKTTALVDAVAQKPDINEDSIAGDYGADADGNLYSAIENGGSFAVKVDVVFKDVDGSSTHYVLVEALPGWICSDAGASQTYIDGKMYFKVPVKLEDINSDGEYSGAVHLKAPDLNAFQLEKLEPAEELHNLPSYKLGVGSLSEESNVSDDEWTLDNNVAYDIKKDAIIVEISKVTSSITVNVGGVAYEDNIVGYDENDKPIHGYFDEATGAMVKSEIGLPIEVSGLSATDKMSDLNFTFKEGSGKILLDGVELEDGDILLTGEKVSISTVDGKTSVTFDKFNPAEDGTGSLSFKPSDVNHNYEDLNLEWSCEINDTLSADSGSQTGVDTIIVDAIAHAAEVSVETIYADGVGDMEAAKPNETVRLDVELTFEVIPGEVPYIFIEQIGGWKINALGPLLNAGIVSMLPIDGDPENGFYYRISAEDALSANLDGFDVIKVDNLDGTITYTFDIDLTAPGANVDKENGDTIKVGGMVTETLTGQDGGIELDLENNRVTTEKEVTLKVGAIDTGKVIAVIGGMTENDASGSDIHLYIAPGKDAGEGDPLTPADEKAESVNETISELNISIAPEEWVDGMDLTASIIYNGKVYFTDAEGKVTIDFGPGGYDSNADFKIVWGKVDVDASGNALTNPDGSYVVSQWNHSGSKDLNISTEVVIYDDASGHTGKSGDKTLVEMEATANAMEGMALDGPDDVVEVTNTVDINIKGEFKDIDGSEDHYFVIEAKDGWSVESFAPARYELLDGTRTIEGKEYFVFKVPGSEANPDITVSLSPPRIITGDGEVDLSAGALSEENGQEALNLGNVEITLDGVTATGVELVLAGEILEDGSSTIGLNILGNSTDKLSEVTFTLKDGEYISDQDGEKHFGTVTLTGDQIETGNWSYNPAPNASGEMSIEYKATVITEKGITGEFVDKGSIQVNPVTDQPTDIGNAHVEFDASDSAPGHKAEIEINLSAKFEDTDGSEGHFFLIQLPLGVSLADLPAGLRLEALNSYDQANFDPSAGPVYKIAVDDPSSLNINIKVVVDQDYEGTDSTGIKVVAGSNENALDADQSQYSGEGTVKIDGDLSELNLGPVAKDHADKLDSLRNVSMEGELGDSVSDADGDTISVTGLKDSSVSGKDDKGNLWYELAGDYGTLRIHEDGSYTYTLKEGLDPDAGQSDSFTYTVSDGRGGEASASINITLTEDNQAPVIEGQISVGVGGPSSVYTGSLSWTDPDGDSMTVSVSINGENYELSGTTVTAQGEYGVLTINPDGSYKYELSSENEHMKGTEDFSVKVTDKFGASSGKDVSIDITPVNHAPEAIGMTGHLKNSHETYVKGSLDIDSFDVDTQHTINEEVINLSHVSFGGTSYDVPTDPDVPLIVDGDYGKLSIYSDGTWIYNLNSGLDANKINELDTFEFTVTDKGGESSSADLNIRLGADAPDPDLDAGFDSPFMPAGGELASFSYGSLDFDSLSDEDLADLMPASYGQGDDNISSPELAGTNAGELAWLGDMIDPGAGKDDLNVESVIDGASSLLNLDSDADKVFTLKDGVRELEFEFTEKELFLTMSGDNAETSSFSFDINTNHGWTDNLSSDMGFDEAMVIIDAMIKASTAG